ncbi:MAG: NADPH2:quinone reductase [Gammaproteobacteria bacterium]|jgi:NADPH2:quinone reductase
MKAVVCRTLGAPEVLQLEQLPAPAPAVGEIAIAPAACGVNFVDVLMVAGGYQLKPPLPFIPGLEGAGTVSALGDGVMGFDVGTRVLFGMRPGAFAESIVAPVGSVLPLPDAMTFEQGACFKSAFSTAFHGLVQGGRLEAGEVVLVHGATGGMGLAAVQVAKRLGATVVATGSDLEKLSVVKTFGADHVLCHNDGDFRQNVRDLVGGVDVVFDPVGGDLFDESMRCLNWGARLVIVGFTSGRPALARTNHVLIKGASVVGIRAGEFGRRFPKRSRENLRTLLRWAQAGEIRSHISHRFPLADISSAMNVIRERKVIGRVVLSIQ